MKLKVLAIALVTITLGSAAFAQTCEPQGGSNGNGGKGGSNGSGSGMGPANGGGNGNGQGGNGMAGIPDIVVVADGTAFLVRHLATDPVGQFEVVAIRTSGAIGWTYKLPTLGIASLVLSDTNVVAVQSGLGLGSQGTPPATPDAAVTKLTALSQASGGFIWTLDVAGKLFDVTSFTGGLYLTVVKPVADATGTLVPGDGLGEKLLVAVSNDGVILWTVPLN
ncbi:MAG: hypothetical protein ACSLFQ_18795 [Thermoanaerobaculia bacterium]